MRFTKARTGDKRHLIMFQSKTEATDSFGATVATWTDGFQMWAAYAPVSSRTFQVADKRFAETTVRFHVEYRAGISPDKNRILFVEDPDASPLVTQIFDIFPPLDIDGQRRELIIEAVNHQNA